MGFLVIAWSTIVTIINVKIVVLFCPSEYIYRELTVFTIFGMPILCYLEYKLNLAYM